MSSDYSFEIDRAEHQQRLRAELEGYRTAGPQLPGNVRHPRLQISVDPRTGSMRVRHPGGTWVSID